MNSIQFACSPAAGIHIESDTGIVKRDEKIEKGPHLPDREGSGSRTGGEEGRKPMFYPVTPGG